MNPKNSLLILSILLVCACASGLAQNPPQTPPPGTPPNRPRIEPPKKGVCPLPILPALPTYADTSFYAQTNVPHGKVEQVNYKNYPGQDKRLHVYLPPDYDKNTSARYPVLYLNHGGGDDDSKWSATDPKSGGHAASILDNLIAANKAKPMIVVMPNTKGCATLEPSMPGKDDACTQEFLKDIIPLVDKSYRTKASREARAIAGLSMGGYGALKFGLKRPDLFCFAGSMSGAFDAPNRITLYDGFGAEELNPSILQVFGEGENSLRNQNDIFQLIKNYPAEGISRLPYFYLDCGVEDGFLEINRNLTDLLKEKKIPFEFHEIEGGHDWNYWDKQIQVILNIVNKIFNRN